MALLAIRQAGAAAASSATEPAPNKLDLLVLGGTGFLGPHQIEYALARGHRVTMFNRGVSAAGMYGDRVETLIGNRDSKIDAGLAALAGSRRWDAVIDNSGYLPRHVRDSAELLKGRVGRYVFVSTLSVYDPEAAVEVDESTPLSKSLDPPTEELSFASYGPLKADCDRAVRAVLKEKATVVRPGFIVGPGDDSDRFTYWVDRLARGGDVLGPPEPARALQWIDARDLCPWIVRLAEQDRGGIYNAVGPPAAWEQVIGVLAKASSAPVRVHWPSAALLAELKLELPLVSGGDRRPRRFAADAARAAGLPIRPLEDTASATLAWWRAQSAERRAEAQGWPTADEERAVLARLGV
jgi:2'-hydroxyisoflavone reductase